MAKQYKGSLSLDWYNKQKAILLRSEEDTKTATDIPAPKITWVNKDEALFYEVNIEEGKGEEPYWVDRNDIRVKEARPLIFQKAYKAIQKNQEGVLPGMVMEFEVVELYEDDATIENILIKGDNLLALNSLKKMFDNKPEEEKIKCIYIDPPYNTQNAFLSEFYEDNLAHSEWLTMMRDRIVLLYSLLRNDGVIIVHLDDQELFYCKILLDEIFGRDNFINSISIRDSHPSGLKLSSKDKTIVKTKSSILCFRKSSALRINPIYQKRYEWDTHYNTFMDEDLLPFSLKETLVNKKIISKEFKIDSNALKFEPFRIFCFENRSKIFQSTKELPDKPKIDSLKNKDSVVEYYDANNQRSFALNGRRLFPLTKSIQDIGIDGNNEEDFAKLLCDFWDDVDFNNTQNEGGVIFPASKKPEFLIGRLITMFSSKNDYVLDCFGGSGSTFAVAHKMGRKWIGVEVGNHAETHILKRMNDVLSGVDQTGISKEIKWKGGGSFKYFLLGESIIKLNEDGTGDFNWSLGKEFIQESFLSSYDYIIDTSIDFREGELFANKKHQPLLGVQTIGTKQRVAVITLNEPKGNLETLSYEEMQSIYKTVKKKFTPEYINIFTNRGIEIAYDSKPDDLEVVKIPNAIFAELEK